MVSLKERAERATRILEVAVEHGKDIVADEAHFVRLIDYFRLYYRGGGPGVSFSRELAAAGGTKALKGLLACRSEPAAAAALTICGLVMLTCEEGFRTAREGGLLDTIVQTMQRSLEESSFLLREALQQLFCSIFSKHTHATIPDALSWALDEARAKDFVVEALSCANGNVRLWSTQTVAHLLCNGMLSPANTEGLWSKIVSGLASDCSEERILGSLDALVALLKENASAPERGDVAFSRLNDPKVWDRCVDLMAFSRNVKDRACDVVTHAVANGVFIDAARIESRLNSMLDSSGICKDVHAFVGVTASIGHGLTLRSDIDSSYFGVLVGPGERMFRAAAQRWIDDACSDHGEGAPDHAMEVIEFMEVWRAWFCKGCLDERVVRVAENWIRNTLRPMLDVMVKKHNGLHGVAQIRRIMISELKRLGRIGAAKNAVQEQMEVLMSMARLPWPDLHNQILIIDALPCLISSDSAGARVDEFLGLISFGLETFTSSELREAVIAMVTAMFDLPGTECYQVAVGDSSVVLPRVWDLMDDGNASVRQAVMDCMGAVAKSGLPREALPRSLHRSKYMRKRKRGTSETWEGDAKGLFEAVCNILRTEGEALVRRATAGLLARLVLSPVYEDTIQDMLNDADSCANLCVTMGTLANDFDWEIKVVVLQLLTDVQKQVLAQPVPACHRANALEDFFSAVQGPDLLRAMLNDVDRVPRQSVASALLLLKAQSSPTTSAGAVKVFVDSLSNESLRKCEGEAMPESVYGDEFTLSEELLAGNIHAALDCY